MTKTSLLKKCSKNFTPFYEWAENYCRKHNKKITIVNKGKLDFEGGQCGGWCDGEEMVSAANSFLFEEVFVHEFSHMMQAVEESEVWEPENEFWTACAKNKVKISSWNDLIRLIALERDCERRALALSKKWNLFDNSIYTKRANLYLFFYHFVFLRGKWVDSTGLYFSEKLIEMMPEKLVTMDKLAVIDMNLMLVFDECLGKGKKCKKVLPVSAALSSLDV